MPAMPEAARVLDSLGPESRLAAAARALGASLRDVPRQPLPFLDAVLGWVVSESRRAAAGHRAAAPGRSGTGGRLGAGGAGRGARAGARGLSGSGGALPEISRL